jgi:PEGA domain-containing protein
MNWARRLAALQAVLLLVSVCANAAEKNTIRIKILDSETHSVVIDDSGVPKNCDQVNFDAYCHNSKSQLVTNTLLVQEGDQPPFRVSCTIDSRWSRCIPQTKGDTLDAKVVKHGLVVYYVDDKGKVRGQLYTVAAGSAKALSASTAVQPEPAPPPRPAPVSAPVSPAPAAAAPAPTVVAPQAAPANVKCNFSSTPAGADITVDGKYVGSTPSEIPLATGTHVVGISMPGFAEWKRELTVEAGAVLNVTANLQKVQP